MKEKNLRFFSFISLYIMQNKIYQCSEEFGMAYTAYQNASAWTF